MKQKFYLATAMLCLLGQIQTNIAIAQSSYCSTATYTKCQAESDVFSDDNLIMGYSFSDTSDAQYCCQGSYDSSTDTWSYFEPDSGESYCPVSDCWDTAQCVQFACGN